MRTDPVRRPRTRRVSIYINDACEAIGWGVEWLEEAEVVTARFCACVSPWPIAKLLGTLDTLSRRAHPSDISWTSWAGGQPPIQPKGQIKVWLPGWKPTQAQFFADGSVQYPLGLSFDDLV